MPLAGAPRDLYMQLLACSLLQSVVAIACFLHAILCFGLYVCLFVSFLADSIQHSSIKVYLSAVRSLHNEQGFTDPLLNCLWLQ